MNPVYRECVFVAEGAFALLDPRTTESGHRDGIRQNDLYVSVGEREFMFKGEVMPQRQRKRRTRRSLVLAVATVVALFTSVIAAVPAIGAQDADASAICDGVAATIVLAEPGLVNGTDGDDVIVGSSGDDIIRGLGGNDTICGGDGDDFILGSTGEDIIFGEGGDDDLVGGPGEDIISGGDGDDLIRGGKGADLVSGDAGADTINAGQGLDSASGGDGDDLLRGGVGSDVLNGDDGDDRLAGGKANDLLRGGAGDDELVGGNGPSDELSGGGGADTCIDRGSNTTLRGCDPDFELTVLHVNDTHSHLSPDSGDLELPGGETRVSIGGFPSVVARIDELAAANADSNVVKIHAGDAITGTLFFSLFEGEADAALLNEACFDIFALGNHEFDNGDQGLADFLADLGASPDCSTTTVAANVVPAPGTPLNVSGVIPFQPYEIIDYGDDQVAYVGIDIAGKTQNSSSPLPTTQFLDEVETAQAVVDELTSEGIDKIVLVTHIGLDNDLDLASMVSGVDVIVGGDSHSLLGDFEDLGLNPVDQYPVRTSNADGDPTCVVQAWEFSAVVGELQVNFDEDGVVTSCAGTPHLILGDTFEREPEEDADREPLVGDELQAVLDFIDETPELSVVTPDADAQAVLDGFSEQVDALSAISIGEVTEDLCLTRIPGEARSAICDPEDTAVNGGDIQQLVAEAFHVRAFESDFSLQNAGGVRIDIPAGPITIADVFELLPFANTLVNLEMTGVEVEAVLEEALAFAIDPDGSTGAYPYAAGLRWDVDLTAADGERISNLEFEESDGVWVPFDNTRTYTVATNDFIAAGRDGYVTFGEVTDDGRSEDTFIDYAQAFIDYIEQDVDGVLSPLPTEQYSTQSIVALPVG